MTPEERATAKERTLSSGLPFWARAGLFSLAFFASAEVGNYLSFQPSNFSTFWPPSGLFVAVLLLSDVHTWPAFILAAFPASLAFDLLHGRPLLISVSFFAGNSLEAFVGAWLVRRFVGERLTLSSLKEVLGLVGFSALFSTTLGATAGATVTVLAYSGNSYWDTWRVWWIANVLGVLVVAPIVLAWATRPSKVRSPNPGRLVELIALLASVTVCTWLIFDTLSGEYYYFVMPFLIWAALRFGPRGVMTSGLALSVVAVWTSSQRHSGAAIGLPVARQVLSLQAFLGVTLLTFLVLAAVLAERRRAEEALRESEDRYRDLVEHSHDLICTHDLDGQILSANQAAEKLLGYDQSITLKKNIRDILAPEVRHEFDTYLATIRKHGVASGLMRVQTSTGERRIWEYRNTLRTEGVVAPIVRGMAHDITERKRADAALARHAREMEALYETSLEINSQPDVPTLLRAIVRRATELLGTPMGALHLMKPDDQALELVVSHNLPNILVVGTTHRLGEGIAGRVAQSGEPMMIRDYRDWEGREPSDAESPFRRMLGVPLKMANKVIGVITVADDQKTGQFDEDQIRLLSLFADQAAIAVENARLRQAEREQFRRLQESQAQLVQAEKMAAVGRLVGSIAHEINNPLQALQNSLTLVNEELEGRLRPGTIKRYLDIAEQSTERIAIILRRVRDFYRPSRQGVRLTDVRALLESVLGLVGDQLQSGNITVKCEWEDQLPPIQANPDHLRQVFLNLVMNAIDVMAVRGGTLRVRTALEQSSLPDNRLLPAVRIEFSDTGRGIPAELLPHLFEPFATTQPGKASLGLSISYAIIQAHGGQITVNSQAGVGTTFTILLPVEEILSQP